MNVELKEFEEENNPHMRIIEKKFESFTRPQQIKHLEVEGYLIIPKNQSIKLEFRCLLNLEINI